MNSQPFSRYSFPIATAIIFLAPISAFDQVSYACFISVDCSGSSDAGFFSQYLEEDPRTNRIDDSLQLWTMVCSNLLLKNAHLVLMLNKVRRVFPLVDRSLMFRALRLIS